MHSTCQWSTFGHMQSQSASTRVLQFLGARYVSPSRGWLRSRLLLTFCPANTGPLSAMAESSSCPKSLTGQLRSKAAGTEEIISLCRMPPATLVPQTAQKGRTLLRKLIKARTVRRCSTLKLCIVRQARGKYLLAAQTRAYKGCFSSLGFMDLAMVKMSVAQSFSTF
jgi:hypothetical protein